MVKHDYLTLYETLRSTRYVIVTTAVLPYADIGAHGQGLKIEFTSGEKEAVKAAVDMLVEYATQPSVDKSEGLHGALAENPKTFLEFHRWFRSYNDEIEECVRRDKHYNNPGNVVTVEIHTSKGVCIFPPAD